MIIIMEEVVEHPLYIMKLLHNYYLFLEVVVEIDIKQIIMVQMLVLINMVIVQQLLIVHQILYIIIQHIHIKVKQLLQVMVELKENLLDQVHKHIHIKRRINKKQQHKHMQQVLLFNIGNQILIILILLNFKEYQI